MKLVEKLALQEQLGGVVLFKEGVFLRAYNEGAYILTELLGHQFKIRCLPLKKRNNTWFVTCAFPVDKLSERLPEAVTTAFGGLLDGDFEMQEYKFWLERRCCVESIANAAAKAGNETLKTYELSAPALPPKTGENLNNINLSLTTQQATRLLNLLNLLKGNNPTQIDFELIESLQQQLTHSICTKN